MSEEIKIPTPDSRIKTTVNGEQKEVFMSAGMIRQLAIVTSDLEDISSVYLDPSSQERCLVTLLVERDARGTPVEDVDKLTMMAFEMEPNDADVLAKWVGDHLLAFFIKGARNMNQSVKLQEEAFQNLAQSLTGTKASMETKPSVGSSESSPAK